MAATAIGNYKPEILDDGRFKVVIDVDGVKQPFIYEDEADLAAKLLVAQENSTKILSRQAQELKELRPLQAERAWTAHKNKEATRFRAQNPDFVLYGQAERVEIENLVCDRLMREHPELSEQLEKTDFAAFDKLRKELFTAENLGRVYMELGEAELLPVRPEAVPATEANKEQLGELSSQPETVANSTASPARTFSTGIRNGTGTHAAPSPKTRSKAEIWAEIDAMRPAEYDRKLATDPEFRKLVDSLGAR